MDVDAATDLLRPIVERGSATWADIGAGAGVFTQALGRLLGPKGKVYAIDRDASAVRELEAMVAASGASIPSAYGGILYLAELRQGLRDGQPDA